MVIIGFMIYRIVLFIMTRRNKNETPSAKKSSVEELSFQRLKEPFVYGEITEKDYDQRKIGYLRKNVIN